MTGTRIDRSGVVAIPLLVAAAIAGCSGFRGPTTPPDVGAKSAWDPIYRLEFLGEAALESGFEFEETVVGGLSALVYDPSTGRFFSLSDDPSLRNPTRIYELSIAVGDGRLEHDEVSVESVLVVQNEQGEPFPEYAIDGEGLALALTGGFYLSSEGHVERGVEPFVCELGRDGRLIRKFPLPRRFHLDPSPDRGPRQNLAFEALSRSPDGRWLFAGMENALADDGEAANLDTPSPARLLRFDLGGDESVEEYLYWVEAVPQAPANPDGFRVNGLVEILALDEERLLSLERAYSADVGNTIRLYLVDLSSAENISGRALTARPETVRAAAKTLLLDLAELGLTLDNVEGLSFGPDLDDGRHTLVLISDDNFNPRQKTQVLAFAWSAHVPTLPEIQGAGHRSPYEGEWLFDVEGVVTAVDAAEPAVRAWIQDRNGDGDPATSDALSFETTVDQELIPGDVVRVSGRVVEWGRSGDLPVTTLAARAIRIVSRGETLPLPRSLGGAIPSRIDDDSLTVFDPQDDALDFFESVEGMRVDVPAPAAVGPATRYGDFVVLAEGERGLGPRTPAGGVLLTEENPNPQRVQIDPRLLSEDRRLEAGTVGVGTSFDGPMIGVLDYSWGMYEVILTEPSTPLPRVGRTSDRARDRGPEAVLSVATFNVENLDALDPDEKFAAVAEIIADDLGSPDIVALQEIQDDNGAVDDGTVSAQATLDRLVANILEAGGPRYEPFQIDPENNADGGQPGANIRVAYLVARDRVRVAARGAGDATTAVRVERFGGGNIGLSHNPGRVAADDDAFAASDALGYAPTRKPLALEIDVDGQQIFLVNVHLKSKGGDDGLFGAVQPPVRHTEQQRLAQTRALRSFVDDLLDADPNAAIIVLGDLNEHQFRPPITALTEDGLINLVETVASGDRYTYNYRGNSQVLDHLLVSPALLRGAAPRTVVVHVNADNPAGDRASDHDPVLVELTFPPR